jgi:hypothetical protein
LGACERALFVEARKGVLARRKGIDVAFFARFEGRVVGERRKDVFAALTWQGRKCGEF